MVVLVVEDEALIRMVVCDALEEAGYRCVEAASAAEAIALLEQGLCRPNLLVTDFELGPGLDGRALAALACQFSPGLPVIYATGSAGAFLSGLGHHERLILKPFTCGGLIAAVREFLSAEPDGGMLPVVGDSRTLVHAAA